MRWLFTQNHPDPDHPAESRFQFRIPGASPVVPPADGEDAEGLRGIDAGWLAALRSA